MVNVQCGSDNSEIISHEELLTVTNKRKVQVNRLLAVKWLLMHQRTTRSGPLLSTHTCTNSASVSTALGFWLQVFN